jgi:predicted phage baseplate assembly protein
MVVPVQGPALAVVGGQQIAPGQAIGVSGQRVRLQVGLDQQDDCQFVPTGSSGSVAVQGGQVYLVTAFPPAADPAITGNLVWQVQTLSGVAGQLSAPATAAAVQLMPASPKNPKDPVVGEAAIVQSVDVAGDVTTLTLVSALNGIYDALSTNVNANAVMGSHGQTVQEILGSGDSSNDALQFTLKQGPLTYLPSPSGTGSQSSLQVWVNNMQWEEVPSLLACGIADRAFVTQAGPSGNRVITFGNGVQGARTPTGVSNIRAVYRAGTGTPGMVGAGQLSQPLDRPQGVQSVINPSAASGAADPAAASDARASAPLPTLMVNRVVSLEDYQNFALNFSGISKALAAWTWSGDVRGAFLTIAGPNGTTLSADDPVVTSLIDAIQLASEPFVPVTVVSFRPVLFTFTAVVAVDQPTYDPNQVLAQVWQSVSTVFAFEQRQLGQGLAASEVVQVIQAVPGVVALQLQSLTSSGERQPQIRERMRRIPGPSGPPAVLPASGPVPPLGAQLLQIDPATQGTITRWYI